GARITNGKYMNINSDAAIVHIKSPFDIQINNLNIQLNNTYIAYGYSASVKKEKQVAEDENAASYGSANMTTRILSKSGKAYKNYSWDMVDAAEQESFEVAKIEKAQLPKEMQGLTVEQKTKYIAGKKAERTAIQNQIKALGKKREVFVKSEREKMSLETQLDDVIISAIIKQAEGKKYTFE
ncbi:MAG: Tfp pilus assembly protein PilV, partial [Saprospiraceae bacterium]